MFYVFLALTMLTAPAPKIDDIEGKISKELKKENITKAINTNNRQSVVDAYRNIYAPVFVVPSGWDGDVSTCNSGNVYPFYNLSVLQMLNYYREMCGLPDLIFDNSYSQGCQESSLIMFKNKILTHQPDPSLLCWTQVGSNTAGLSNIGWGSGPVGVLSCFNEGTYGNDEVGHRRWFLFPPLLSIGSGSVYESYYNGVNTTQVFTEFGARPSAPEFISWPPKGFVPYSVVFAKWSFSLANSNLSQSIVKMRKIGGSNISLTKYPVVNGYGDPTIVWLPNLSFSQGMPDKTYEVTIENVKVGSVTKKYIYRVTVIDAGQTPVFTPYITPSPSPSMSPSMTVSLTPSLTPTPRPNGFDGWEGYD